MQEVFEKIIKRISYVATEACGYTPITRVASEAELKEIIEQEVAECNESLMTELLEAKKNCGEDSDCSGCIFGQVNDRCYLQELQIGNSNGWIPVKYHVVTDKEREEECISEDIAYYLDCKMPDDGEQIIVTDGENMWSDICFVDIYYSLDSGYDWINDIVAWRAMPAKYQSKGE